MTYNPDIHNRKSIRLKDYDYSQEGLYFITVCAKNNEDMRTADCKLAGLSW
jgi:hypothetical protein